MGDDVANNALNFLERGWNGENFHEVTENLRDVYKRQEIVSSVVAVVGVRLKDGVEIKVVHPHLPQDVYKRQAPSGSR